MRGLTEIQHRFLSELNRAVSTSISEEESFYLSLNSNASLSILLRAVASGNYLLESFDNRCVVVMNKAVLDANNGPPSPIRVVLNLLKKITVHPYFKNAYANTENLMVVELGVGQIDFCSAEIKGLRHVYISATSKIENALTHELTHALCETGNRFLDEGLAMYMEEQLNGSLDDFEYKKSRIPAEEKLSDYRFAICSQAQAGVFLSDTEKYSAEYIEAYHAITKVSAGLAEELLFSALAELRRCSSGLQQFDALSEFLDSRDVWYHDAELVPDPNLIENEIIKSMISKQLSESFEKIRAVFYKVPTDSLSIEEKVAWCLMWLRYLQISLSRKKVSIMADLANISYLAQCIKGEPCCQADYFLIQAQVESLRLQTTHSLEKLSEHSERYYQYIAEAERLDPDCPRVLFESAISDLHKARQTRDKKVWRQQMNEKMERLLNTPYGIVIEQKRLLQKETAV